MLTTTRDVNARIRATWCTQTLFLFIYLVEIHVFLLREILVSLSSVEEAVDGGGFAG